MLLLKLYGSCVLRNEYIIDINGFEIVKSFSFSKNNFNIIRLVAATQVALDHGWAHLRISYKLPFFIKMFPGVLIFFVISGFLISASYERSPDRKQYLLNRTLRIYPGLYACFFFSVVTVLWFNEIDFQWGRAVPWACAQLTIGQFYNPDFFRQWGVGVLNGSLWTISVELQFYLLLPFIYFFLLKIKQVTNFIIIGLIIIFAAYSWSFFLEIRKEESLANKLVAVTTFPYLYMFLLGVILQRNRQLIKKYLAGKAVYWVVIYFVIALALHLLGERIYGNYLSPVLAVFLSLLIISIAYTRVGIGDKFLRGQYISYGVYLYHMVVINVFVQRNLIGQTTYLIFAMIITAMLAMISWRLVERPCLRLKKYSVKVSS